MKKIILIAYFSRAGENYMRGKIVNLEHGNTEIAAGTIARLTGAPVFRIVPMNEYPEKYKECTEAAQKELMDRAAPQIRSYPDNDDYETLILGYPCWWGTMPMPVWTFIRNTDLSGKKILPFCTNEGSGLGSSIDDLKRLCPGAEIRSGLSILGADVKDSEPAISDWLHAEKII